jgi:predicted nuclease of predicted toxin-antitoxin system
VQFVADENLVWLTADKDFGELVYRQQQLSTGVVLVRLAGVDPYVKAIVVVSAVTQLGDSLADAIPVTTSTSVRHRPGGRVVACFTLTAAAHNTALTIANLTD